MVAIKGRAIDAVLQKPDPVLSAFLIYGPDRGLVSERSNIILEHFASDPGDPFSVSRLDEASLAKNPERLIEELNSLAFGAARRTVVLRLANPGIMAAVAQAISQPRSAALIVQAGDLRPTSPLRKAFEAAPDGAAIPCYLDDSKLLLVIIKEILSRQKQTISDEARQVLTDRLGSDRLGSRAEIEKLSLYCGPNCQISTADVLTATADTSEALLDSICDAIGEGRHAEIERVMNRALAAGQMPPAVVAGVVRHFCRLHEASAAILAGKSATAALAGLRPPVFFMRRDSMLRQLSRWAEPELRRAMAILASAEVDARLGPQATTATSRTLLRLALLPRRRSA